MSKHNKKAGIIASAVIGAGLAIGAATTGILIANQPIDITYYANNGTPAVSAQIKNSDNSKLPTPTREGYNFAGWYLDTGLTQQVTSTTKLKQNSKLYAGWELANYEVAAANSVDLQAETAGLKSIGQYAFANSKITSITIPDTVTTIGEGAFENCTDLTNLTIGKNVQAIENNAFCNCTALTNINFNAIACGDISSTHTIFENAGTSASGVNVIFGSSVSSIPTRLFAASDTTRPKITSVSMGENVISIGASAFANLDKLTGHLVIPDGVTTINSGAFANCTALSTLTIGEGITTLSGFSGCININSLNFNAVNCADFESSPFSKLGTANSGVEVVFGDKVTRIPANLFYVNTDSFSPNIASATIGSNVTSIGESAFQNCRMLRNIVYADRSSSNKALSIEESAFRYCVILQQIEIPAFVTDIENYAFFNCSSAENIILPTSSTLTTINDNTFARCSSITSLVIPDYITTLSNESFSGCSSLANISIGKSVSAIRNTTFNDCYNIESIVVDSQNTTYNSMNNCNCLIRTATNAIVKGCKNSTIPDGVKAITQDAFYGCYDLTSIYIPSSVTSIEALSFYGCYRNLQIYCGASSKPNGWQENWNCYGRNILTNSYLLYKDNVQVFWSMNRSDV